MSRRISEIMQQIDDENNAAQQALYGLSSGSAKHSFINAHYDRIGVLRQELSGVVGSDDDAMGLIVDRLNGNGGRQ